MTRDPSSAPTPTDSVPGADADPEVEAEAGSDAFAAALAAFERSKASAESAKRASTEVVAGTKVHGTVLSIGPEHTLVDIGGRSEAVVETRHFQNEDGTLRITVGEALDLYVIEAGDQIVLAPSMRADPHGALESLRAAKAAGVPVSGRVTALNTGGLAVDVSGARGFCPLSQIEARHCEDASVYVGRTLEFLVTGIEEGRGSVVLSRRQLLRRAEEEEGRKLLASLKPGDERDGTVARLEPFGAFVDLGGVDGMVHVSEIRHERTAHPRDVLHVGEPVRVRVLRLETGRDGRPKIALSMKAATPDPWDGIDARFVAGARAQGTVVRLAEFGAFVNLAPGIDGMVHISEIALQRITHPKEALTVGQAVEAVVLGTDREKKRVSLSIRRALEGDVPPTRIEVGAAEDAPAESRSRPRDRAPAGRSGPREGGRAPSRPRDGGRSAGPGPRDREKGGSFDYTPRPAAPNAPPELTTMAIALRKAMESAKQREQ